MSRPGGGVTGLGGAGGGAGRGGASGKAGAEPPLWPPPKNASLSQYEPRGVSCREAVNECDIAETCTGDSSQVGPAQPP